MQYVTAILPSVGVLFLFVLAIRAIFHADQRERLAQARIERQAERHTRAEGDDSRVKDGTGEVTE